LTGACLTSAVDTIGSSVYTNARSSYLSSNVYRIDRSRTLTQIEQYFTVTGTSVFTWVVYEGSSLTGSFTKLAEVTTSSSGTGVFHGSGPMNVQLKAGKFYIIGAIVQGAHTSFYAADGVSPFVSFGQAVSQLQVSASTPPASYNVGTDYYLYRLYQRLTTAKGS
jgi:hypothetical protein